MSYKAIIVRANPKPHPNADRLQIMDAFGDTVVVGIEVKAGDLGIFFPVDGQLSEEFATQNDLIRRKDEAGNPAGGFFDPNRKVRAQKIRGVISNGFWIPIRSLDYITPMDDLSDLKEGLLLDTLDGHELCRKYVTPATQAAQESGQKKQGTGRHETLTFPMHDDTGQLMHNLHALPEGALVVVTVKAHGTSGRVGFVLDEKPVAKWKSRLRQLWDSVVPMHAPPAWLVDLATPRAEYTYLHGTRRVILSRKTEFGNDFHSHDLRSQVADRFSGLLKMGELVFFEVVGYEPSGKPIMNSVSTTKLADKSFSARYGQTMDWSYGCEPGKHRILVYRIAYSMPDGNVVDLPWRDVKRRAAEMGLETVREVGQMIYQGFRSKGKLLRLVQEHAVGTDPLGSHWREGVCVRVDGADPRVYKFKNEVFKFLESITKDDPTVVDAEEAA